MSFLLYDIVFLVVFTSFVAWFLYTRKHNLKREGLLYLYRTKFGMMAIDKVSVKYKKSLNWLQYVSIACGYTLMAVMLFLFFQIVYIYIKYPSIVRTVKVPPVIPLVPYLPEIFKLDFLPPFYFTYWIVILAVVAISHEFAHGIFARFHKIKVKSTGFGFLGPFLAAFVEPDEKQMQKKSIKEQLAVLSAGTFANVIVAILFVFIFFIFSYLVFVPSGAIFNAYPFSDINLSQVTMVNGKEVSNLNSQGILANLNTTNENNLTKIYIGHKSYLLNNVFFAANIDKIDSIVRVYDDLPAVNAGLSGAIIEFNGQKISNIADFREELLKYKPGDKITIKTKDQNKVIKEYSLTLVQNQRGEPAIGVLLLNPSTSGIKGKIYYVLNIIKEPGTYYESRFNTDLTDFIYDLLWWMIFINISVALVNMLPLGLFDGGRVFYLTVLHFTKSDDKAQKAFKFVTWILLLALGVIMIFWFFSTF
ncbi:site-2 protease family protein [Candidatus Pacearchaeota archaeon]|nr:site-2 protease family protein [Candidatus Pacearchaeota archaeon]